MFSRLHLLLVALLAALAVTALASPALAQGVGLPTAIEDIDLSAGLEDDGGAQAEAGAFEQDLIAPVAVEVAVTAARQKLATKLVAMPPESRSIAVAHRPPRSAAPPA